MSKINWQTAFATASLTIAGLIGAVFTSYQLLETNYRGPIEGLRYETEILRRETDKLLAESDKLLAESVRQREDFEINESGLREICHLISKEENLSDEARQYCFNLLTAHGHAVKRSDAHNKEGLGTALQPPQP